MNDDLEIRSSVDGSRIVILVERCLEWVAGGTVTIGRLLIGLVMHVGIIEIVLIIVMFTSPDSVANDTNGS